MIFQNECSLASTLRLHPRWWFMSWWAQKWGLPTSSNKLGVVRKNHWIMRAFPLCFRIQLLGKRAMNVGATFRKLRSFARIGDSPIGGTPDTLPFFGLTPPMFGCSHHGVMYIFTHMEIEWNQYVYSNKDYIIIYIYIFIFPCLFGTPRMFGKKRLSDWAPFSLLKRPPSSDRPMASTDPRPGWLMLIAIRWHGKTMLFD